MCDLFKRRFHFPVRNRSGIFALGLHEHSGTGSARGGKAVLLLAKSAFAAAPHREMQRIAAMVGLMPGVTKAHCCFSEQGSPSLRDALRTVSGGSFATIVIVPLVLPMEPSFHNWLTRSLKRWQAEDGFAWPPVRIARDIAQSLHFEPLLAALVAGTAAEPPVLPDSVRKPESSLVPAQKRRVLVCEGGACNAAGADVIWGHLRNRQVERKLRLTGDGTMTAKSTCLGPCNLAPVLQVFPEGTYYGGVTEAAVDRIVEEHLLGGHVVSDFAYAPTGRKQRLRTIHPKNPEKPKI